MARKKNIYKILFAIFLVAFVGVAILYFAYPSCEEADCPEPEKKALMEASAYDWGYNELNEEEIIFNYWVYNYGDMEAGNVKVRCKIADESDKVVVSALFHVGNVASKSYQFEEDYKEITITLDENMYYTAWCYVENCDNCEILYERIPELIESYQ